MTLTLWFIVAALIACAVASTVMVRAQSAHTARSEAVSDRERREIDIAGDAA
jgi:hypothetical protein